MRWQIKCAINTCKALMPFHAQLRKMKRNVSGYRHDVFNEDATIEQGLQQIEWIRQAQDIEGAAVVEIGSGWEPLIPILFVLAGARRVYLTDLNRLLNESTLECAVSCIRRHRKSIVRRLGIEEEWFDELLGPNLGVDAKTVLERLCLTYLAPCDCRGLPLDGASIDIVISRAVLEHIPPQVIASIYEDAFRYLKPSGLMCHIIDNSDHWEHIDKRLSRVNFVRYPAWAFRLTHVNGLDYQNRLRHSEHLDLVTKAGFHLLRDEGTVDQASLRALESLRLSEDFCRFTPEDIATLTTYVLAQKPPAQPLTTLARALGHGVMAA